MANLFDNDKLMTLLEPSEFPDANDVMDSRILEQKGESVVTEIQPDTLDAQLKGDTHFVQVANHTLPVLSSKEYRLLPTIIALSAVFPSFRRPKVNVIEREAVGVYDGHLLTYESGHPLNVYDEEIVMAIFQLFSEQQLPLNNKIIKIKLSDLTRFIGKSHGGKNNAWLLSRLKVLRGATFSLTSMDMDPNADRGSVLTFTILSYLSIENGYVYLALDSKWAELFATFPIALIYSTTRIMLHSAHARVLHRIFSSSNKSVQVLSESRLIKLLGWCGTRKRDFWAAVKKGSDELIEKEVVKSYRMYKSQRGETLISYTLDLNKLKPGMSGLRFNKDIDQD